MAASDVQTWLSLLGAGSVGGFLSDWLLKRGEKRVSRGHAQDRIQVVIIIRGVEKDKVAILPLELLQRFRRRRGLFVSQTYHLHGRGDELSG